MFKSLGRQFKKLFSKSTELSAVKTEKVTQVWESKEPQTSALGGGWNGLMNYHEHTQFLKVANKVTKRRKINKMQGVHEMHNIKLLHKKLNFLFYHPILTAYL